MTQDVIHHVSPKDLKPRPDNRNKHPKEQIDRLIKIIEYQGFRRPITVSTRSGFVVAGHGRLEAAKKMKLETVPVLFQDYESDDQEYADHVADNSLQAWAELDLSGINTDVANLGPDFDIELLGIKDFVLEPAEKFEAQCDEDEVPEQADTRVKLGDIWQLGRHRLMCGDSTSVTDVEKLMAGEKADLVFTDPPYGMKLDTDYTKIRPSSERHAEFQKAKGKTTNKNYSQVIGDHDDFTPDLINTIFSSFAYCHEIFVWGADYYAELLPNKNDGSWIVWDKRSNEDADEASLDNMFGSAFELCWSRAKHKRQIARIKYAGLFGTETQDIKKRIHPTQKPIQLAQWFFDRWGKGKQNIVDLYGGSGSTLIACEKTNRRCFMMELDPHYCDVILARWEKYTGKKAEQVSG